MVKLREPQYAKRFTECGLSELKNTIASTLIFQQNDNRNIQAQHIGIDRHAIHEGTSRCSDVAALPLAAAVNTTGQTLESNSDCQATWKTHSESLALKTPRTAPQWSDMLLNVEFKKQKDYAMARVPALYDQKAEVVHVKPRLHLCSDVDEIEFEDVDETSISQNERPKDSSARSSGKRQKSNNGNAVPSGTSESHPPPPISTSRPPPSAQLAVYAAERLSSSVAVRHSIDFLVIGE